MTITIHYQLRKINTSLLPPIENQHTFYKLVGEEFSILTQSDDFPKNIILDENINFLEKNLLLVSFFEKYFQDKINSFLKLETENSEKAEEIKHYLTSEKKFLENLLKKTILEPINFFKNDGINEQEKNFLLSKIDFFLNILKKTVMIEIHDQLFRLFESELMAIFKGGKDPSFWNGFSREKLTKKKWLLSYLSSISDHVNNLIINITQEINSSFTNAIKKQFFNKNTALFMEYKNHFNLVDNPLLKEIKEKHFIFKRDENASIVLNFNKIFSLFNDENLGEVIACIFSTYYKLVNAHLSIHKVLHKTNEISTLTILKSIIDNRESNAQVYNIDLIIHTIFINKWICDVKESLITLEDQNQKITISLEKINIMEKYLLLNQSIKEVGEFNKLLKTDPYKINICTVLNMVKIFTTIIPLTHTTIQKFFAFEMARKSKSSFIEKNVGSSVSNSFIEYLPYHCDLNLLILSDITLSSIFTHYDFFAFWFEKIENSYQLCLEKILTITIKENFTQKDENYINYFDFWIKLYFQINALSLKLFEFENQHQQLLQNFYKKYTKFTYDLIEKKESIDNDIILQKLYKSYAHLGSSYPTYMDDKLKCTIQDFLSAFKAFDVPEKKKKKKKKKKSTLFSEKSTNITVDTSNTSNNNNVNTPLITNDQEILPAIKNPPSPPEEEKNTAITIDLTSDGKQDFQDDVVVTNQHNDLVIVKSSVDSEKTTLESLGKKEKNSAKNSRLHDTKETNHSLVKDNCPPIIYKKSSKKNNPTSFFSILEKEEELFSTPAINNKPKNALNFFANKLTIKKQNVAHNKNEEIQITINYFSISFMGEKYTEKRKVAAHLLVSSKNIHYLFDIIKIKEKLVHIEPHAFYDELFEINKKIYGEKPLSYWQFNPISSFPIKINKLYAIIEKLKKTASSNKKREKFSPIQKSATKKIKQNFDTSTNTHRTLVYIPEEFPALISQKKLMIPNSIPEEQTVPVEKNIIDNSSPQEIRLHEDEDLQDNPQRNNIVEKKPIISRFSSFYVNNSTKKGKKLSKSSSSENLKINKQKIDFFTKIDNPFVIEWNVYLVTIYDSERTQKLEFEHEESGIFYRLHFFSNSPFIPLVGTMYNNISGEAYPLPDIYRYNHTLISLDGSSCIIAPLSIARYGFEYYVAHGIFFKNRDKGDIYCPILDAKLNC